MQGLQPWQQPMFDGQGPEHNDPMGDSGGNKESGDHHHEVQRDPPHHRSSAGPGLDLLPEDDGKAMDNHLFQTGSASGPLATQSCRTDLQAMDGSNAEAAKEFADQALRHPAQGHTECKRSPSSFASSSADCFDSVHLTAGSRPQPSIIFLKCRVCAHATDGSRDEFQLVHHRTWCKHCRKCRFVRLWVCSCAVQWHSCPQHQGEPARLRPTKQPDRPSPRQSQTAHLGWVLPKEAY